MATPSFTDKSSAPSREESGVAEGFRPQPAELQFPDAGDFISKPPRLPWLAIFQRSEEGLRFKTSQPGFEERRLKSKTSDEFIL
jgi:hypothetical protein